MFSIEKARTGKPHILFNNSKFRQSYSVKNGDVIWCCLGRECGATLKTDDSMTTLLFINDKHTGKHPVTLRRLSTQRPLTSTPPQSSPSTPHTPPPEPAPAPFTTPVAAPSSALELENCKLKEEILRLESEMQDVLDHSIESDTRLIEFTNRVFVTRAERDEDTNLKTDQATQCDTSIPCTDPRCAASLELVSSLRTTVEVLEAEIMALRAEAKSCDCSKEETQSGWTVQQKNPPPLTLKNKFSVLNKYETKLHQQNLKPNNFIKNKKSQKIKKFSPLKIKLKEAQPKPTSHQPTRTDLSFSSIIIEGDSHVRGLSALLQHQICSTTAVSGMCKPGGGLLAVTSDEPPPPDSCSVLITGTNDIAAGESHNIFKHLEQLITDRRSAARVIVANLPHRHDLPGDHPVHQQTRLVNHYVEELCARHDDVHLLDFNSIQRRWFTKHGMHLRPAGKRLLSRMMLRCLMKADLPAPTTVPVLSQQLSTNSSPLANPLQNFSFSGFLSPQPSPSPIRPRVLPFDTYAEAVKSPSKNFLVQPLLATNQN